MAMRNDNDFPRRPVKMRIMSRINPMPAGG